jgi:hypothetical protein
LQEYAYVPDYIQGAEREQYLKEFGERALRARTDMWRMYNRMPQKYNTFVPSERHPGAYTAPEDIKSLKWIPTPNESVNGVDFVNSVGGNTGRPIVTNLGRGIPDGENVLSKEFGVTTVSDLWDLHPFSRSGDRVIDRLQRGWNKTIGNTLNNYSKKVKRLSENLKYDNKEIEKWIAANKDDEFAMDIFDPNMFPNTGWRRKFIQAERTKNSQPALVSVLTLVGRDLGKTTSVPCASFSSSGKCVVGLKSAVMWPTEIVG